MLINKMIQHIKTVTTSVILLAIVLAVTLISMWDAEVGFGVLKEGAFWVAYAITSSVGLIVQATVASSAIDVAKVKYKVETLVEQILTAGYKIVTDRNMGEFQLYVKQINESRVKTAREEQLSRWATSSSDKKVAKAIKIENELKLNDYTSFNKIKVSVKYYTVKQIMSVGLATGADDYITANVNSFMAGRAVRGTLLKLPVIAMVSILMFTNTVWAWDNVHIWLLRLSTVGMGIVGGFVTADEAVLSVQIPALQLRYNLLGSFDAKKYKVEVTTQGDKNEEL